jgi:hypothetical protein
MKKYIIVLLLMVGFVLNLDAISLTIKTLTGRNVSLEVDKNITIRDLKNKIQEIVGIPPQDQQLVSGGRELNDFETLEDLNFQDKTVIYTLFKPSDSPEPSIPQTIPQKMLPKLTMRQKTGAAAFTIAALTAAVAAVMKIRSYKNTKKRLIKKYNLAALTPLQNKIWLATALASHGIPWYLDYMVHHTQGSLADLIGADPRALAELYYGHMPTANEIDVFLRRFFSIK